MCECGDRVGVVGCWWMVGGWDYGYTNVSRCSIMKQFNFIHLNRYSVHIVYIVSKLSLIEGTSLKPGYISVLIYTNIPLYSLKTAFNLK